MSAATSAPPGTPPSTVDPADAQGLAYWAQHFGVNSDQLRESVQAVGGDPQAVREHLLNQGGSAGAS